MYLSGHWALSASASIPGLRLPAGRPMRAQSTRAGPPLAMPRHGKRDAQGAPAKRNGDKQQRVKKKRSSQQRLHARDKGAPWPMRPLQCAPEGASRSPRAIDNGKGGTTTRHALPSRALL